LTIASDTTRAHSPPELSPPGFYAELLRAFVATASSTLLGGRRATAVLASASARRDQPSAHDYLPLSSEARQMPSAGLRRLMPVFASRGNDERRFSSAARHECHFIVAHFSARRTDAATFLVRLIVFHSEAASQGRAKPLMMNQRKHDRHASTMCFPSRRHGRFDGVILPPPRRTSRPRRADTLRKTLDAFVSSCIVSCASRCFMFEPRRHGLIDWPGRAARHFAPERSRHRCRKMPRMGDASTHLRGLRHSPDLIDRQMQLGPGDAATSLRELFLS